MCSDSKRFPEKGDGHLLLKNTQNKLKAAAQALSRGLKHPARVLVGMSGGVDSSVAAALLVQAGFHVSGAYMKNWILDVPGMRCPWADDLADAKRIAVRLGIDFHVYDFQEIYKRDVVDYLVREYQAGRTPNPDIMCNQDVKFGAFLDAAKADGFDFIATGHYAASSLLNGSLPVLSATNQEFFTEEVLFHENHSVRLLCAEDSHKDQTYFLYRMPQHAVAQTIFPLGGLKKHQVRQLAQTFGFDTANKPDSQGICFVGEAGIREFLSLYVKPSTGPIVNDETGETLGYHDGAINFTIGQRKGLGIGGGAQYYVSRKDMNTNTVYVREGRASVARQEQLVLTQLSWISGKAPANARYMVRAHHGEVLNPACINVQNGECVVEFSSPHETVAPGQSVVIYDKNVCLGGGIAS